MNMFKIALNLMLLRLQFGLAITLPVILNNYFIMTENKKFQNLKNMWF